MHEQLVSRHAAQPGGAAAPFHRGIFHRNAAAFVCGQKRFLPHILRHVGGGPHVAQIAVDHRLMRADQKFKLFMRHGNPFYRRFRGMRL